MINHLSRLIPLADDLVQSEPVGWLVYESDYCTDCMLFANRSGAIAYAEDVANDQETDYWPIYPLWAGNAARETKES